MSDEATGIILHNDGIYKQIDILEQKFREELEKLEAQIVPPCRLCPYDGVYRCEACQESRFEGFNIGDYPR